MSYFLFEKGKEKVICVMCWESSCLNKKIHAVFILLSDDINNLMIFK